MKRWKKLIQIYFINCVSLFVCLSVMWQLYGRTSLCIQMALTRVNIRVCFFFLFFFFFLRPFPAGCLVFAFKWRCPGLISGFFFFSLFRPFPAGCPKLIPGFFFSPFSDGLPRVNNKVFFFPRPFPTFAFKWRCPRLITVTEGRGYPLVLVITVT